MSPWQSQSRICILKYWHSTHATRGKRRRFAPPFPPCCIRRGFVSASIFRVSSALGQAGIAADRKYSAAAGPGNCGPTYSAIVGATIIFDFWKIIIRGLPILGWIRLFTTCCDSAPASPRKPHEFATNITRTKQSWDLGKAFSDKT